MTKRTLTDELRSVLLFHSLQAPEPEDTVTRILTSTVGVPAGTSEAAAAAESTATAAEPAAAELAAAEPAVTGESGSGTGRRWRPSGQFLAAACVVAVIVLAAAGINTARHHDSAPVLATAAQGSASQAQDQASQRGSDSTRGPMLVSPRASTGRVAAPARPPVHVGPTLDCSTIPGSHLRIGAWDDLQLSTGQQRYVYEFLCIGSDGQRSASEVQMFEQAGDTPRYLATLLKAADGQHVDFLVGGIDSLRIQASEHRVARGQVPGAVVSMSWALSSARSQRSTALVAPPCLSGDLAATVIPAAGQPSSWRLVLRNQTGTACALEGFPTVVAMRNGTAVSGAAARKLNGPAGGVTKKPVPPIIVLAPGATASAIIEQSAASAGSCSRSDQVAVTLPNGVPLGELKASMPVCGLVVHPLVGNSSGSD